MPSPLMTEDRWAGFIDTFRLLQERGDWAEQCALIELYLHEYPGDFRLHYFLGGAENRRGRLRQAVLALKDAIDRGGRHPEVYLQIATCYQKLGAVRLAFHFAKEAHILQPADPATNVFLGRFAQQSGDLDEAIRCYMTAWDAQFEREYLCPALAGCLIDVGQHDEAREMFLHASPKPSMPASLLYSHLYCAVKLEIDQSVGHVCALLKCQLPTVDEETWEELCELLSNSKYAEELNTLKA